MRAAQSGLVMSLGMVQLVGNLYVPEATESKKAAAFKNCCKECHDTDGVAQPVNLRNHCERGHGPFGAEGVIKGRLEDDKSITIVGSKEEVAEVKKTTLEAKRIDLVVHEAEEFDAALFPSDLAWIFQPTGPNDFYHVLMSIMDEAGRIENGETSYCLTGALRVRDSEHVVKLTKWNNQLVLRAQLRPEQLNEFAPVAPKELTDKNLNMGRTLIAMQVEDFDAENYKDENRQRLAEWLEARRGGVTVPVTTGSKPKAAVQDLDDLLAQAVAAAAAKAS